jgi:hypothetical protein
MLATGGIGASVASRRAGNLFGWMPRERMRS